MRKLGILYRNLPPGGSHKYSQSQPAEITIPGQRPLVENAGQVIERVWQYFKCELLKKSVRVHVSSDCNQYEDMSALTAITDMSYLTMIIFIDYTTSCIAITMRFCYILLRLL